MGEDSGRRRPRAARRGRSWPALRRAGALTAALAGTALLAAACGGSSPTPTSKKQAAYEAMLAYSQCMRAHGEPDFPDPQPNGQLVIGQKAGAANGSSMSSASKACQHLLPKITPMTAAQQRRITAQALKFVACMRTHGFPDMPDPVVNAQGVEFRLGSPGHHGPRPSSQVLQSAQQACHSLMPGAPP